MSVPSGVLRYAGIWNVTDTYIPGLFVQSSLVNNWYAVLQTVTGGADPSVALAPDWVAFPPSGGGGGVTTLNTLAGAITLQSPDGSITITPSGQNIDLQTIASNINLEGLQNKLGIFPALPLVTDVIETNLERLPSPGTL